MAIDRYTRLRDATIEAVAELISSAQYNIIDAMEGDEDNELTGAFTEDDIGELATNVVSLVLERFRGQD